MPTRPDPFAIDLQHGMIPISKAAAALAALIRRSQAQRAPIVVTQKGYPSAVLLGIELFAELRARAARPAPAQEPPPAEATPEPAPAPMAEEPTAPARKSRGGRKPRAAS